jgi:hypothetical protein
MRFAPASAALLLLASLNPAPAAPVQDGFRWLTDLDAAMSQAAASGRPLLIVFR